MFDPLTQRDYYAVRAVFEPHNVRLDRLPGFPDLKANGLPRVYDAQPATPTYLFLRGDDRTPDTSKPIPPGVPEALGGVFKAEPVTLPRSASDPDRRPFVVAQTRRAAADAVTRARASLEGARRDVARAAVQAWAAGPLGAPAALGAGERPANALRLAEADAALAEAKEAALTAALAVEALEEAGTTGGPRWEEAAKAATRTARQSAVAQARRDLLAAPDAPKRDAAQKALAKAEADLKAPDTTAFPRRQVTTYPAVSTGRRRAFAEWLTSRDNPLAARVAVNHVWARHFGEPLVPSTFDFGRNGRPPSHPALVDWLAADFMEHGWSMKRLHRLIVTSKAYRMASTPDEANLAEDRDNRYLWRMSSRRLEAEAVRDGVFFVAGRLDLTLGGPDIDHNQGLTVPRRSLYFRHAAEKQMEMLKLFDAPSVTECYLRKESIQPQQALALANSELALRMSRIAARDLNARHKDDALFVAAAYERVLSRSPTDAEKAECVSFLKEQTARHAAAKTAPAPLDAEGKAPAADPALRARENLLHVLVNHHEFVTVR
jgi:hypothetical protein